jgi:hypothetical protein
MHILACPAAHSALLFNQIQIISLSMPAITRVVAMLVESQAKQWSMDQITMSLVNKLT